MVRDEKMDWRPEAIKFTDEMRPFLTSSLNVALADGFTTEDWYYMISHTSQDVILDKHFEVSK